MTELYLVTKRIRYHHPEHELGGKLVEPGTPEAQEGLPMDHLPKAKLQLLVRKRYLKKKPKTKVTTNGQNS